MPPISYLMKCLDSDSIILEQHEHYVKQTYRNRCNIYGPNGKQTLVIPVVHNNIFRTPINKVRISNETKWNNIHWKSVCAAYRNSPYFEFYEDDFRNLFENPEEFLFEFNLKLLKIIFDCFQVKAAIQLTENYQKITENPSTDLRNYFHPKKIISSKKPYRQVFKEKHGFIDDLSCIDYLFNAGNKIDFTE